jgi:hypothetical protein
VDALSKRRDQKRRDQDEKDRRKVIDERREEDSCVLATGFVSARCLAEKIDRREQFHGERRVLMGL